MATTLADLSDALPLAAFFVLCTLAGLGVLWLLHWWFWK